ncbi:hypothetical protein GCK32_022649 [Trichostrongylus colubriformis]|uniref:Uncharacterized protein n=1 Tax=Trichostrongylus colubriformis TaxID=6319 RepID=A0AAN8G7E0_TRICO
MRHDHPHICMVSCMCLMNTVSCDLYPNASCSFLIHSVALVSVQPLISHSISSLDSMEERTIHIGTRSLKRAGFTAADKNVVIVMKSINNMWCFNISPYINSLFCFC